MHEVATREAYGKVLAKLIVENEQIVVLDADLTKSTKTCDAKNVCAHRHFNMGIAEANMMCVAAGMAASDKIVFASSFAMFAAGRAFEQIRNSIAYPNLNVKVCATHAGISVGEDGASHQAIEDIALMRSIPNMRVLQPCDDIETIAMIQEITKFKGPCYVRLGRCPVRRIHEDNYRFEMNKGDILHKGKGIAIIATGLMVQVAMDAASLLEDVADPTIINIHTIKPLDANLIIETAKHHYCIITCEEHSIIGGLGSAVSEILAPYPYAKHLMVGIKDCFGESGTPNALLKKYGLDAGTLVNLVKENI